MATPPQDTNQRIVVIGAGVIGLSTAVLLQQKFTCYEIVIVAAEFPADPPLPLPDGAVATGSDDGRSDRPSVDYASMWAGAHYRPIPPTSPQLVEERKLCFRTALRMKGIARTTPEAGVLIVPAEEYLEAPPDGYLALNSDNHYAGQDDGFSILEQRDLPPGVKWGCRYQTYVVNVHIYCTWLLENFRKRGGTILQKKLDCVEDLFHSGDQNGNFPEMQIVPSVIVNCSGRNFDRDPKMQIIRGQTVLVRNPYPKTVTRQNADGSWSFLIPRPLSGGTIVGGTKEINDSETQPRADSRRQLLQSAVKFFPDFVADVNHFEVIMDNIGRRPWRDGGLRIEIEDLGQGRQVVHGYGAGGRGYELSWGAAEDITALVDQVLRRQRTVSKL